MGMGRRQLNARDHLVSVVVIKPVFPRLEAGDDGVASFLCVFRGMLAWGTVAASNVAALGASAQVKPPAAGR
jgi:hypothetical protein